MARFSDFAPLVRQSNILFNTLAFGTFFTPAPAEASREAVPVCLSGERALSHAPLPRNSLQVA